MKSTLRKCLCLAALASSALLLGPSDASACHRSGCRTTRCFTLVRRCRPTCQQTCYAPPVCTTYAQAPVYAAPQGYAPAPVYSTPQGPPKGGMVPPPPVAK
jgi:hypothetical protein